MKRFINISVSFTLITALLFGYTGVPVYKMVCVADGETIVSVIDLKDICAHDAAKGNTKSCCKPVKNTSSCCDYSSGFFQLHESTVIPETQNTTGHFHTTFAFAFNNVRHDLSNAQALFSTVKITSPLCKLKPKQSTQSIIQSFLI